MNRIIQLAIAWSVHAYTIAGGVLGLMALVAIVENRIPQAFILLAIAIVIDMTDGFFARRARVSEVIPTFDGAKVDDLVDFLTYVWAPVLILHVEGMISHSAWLILPVVGSLYAYGRPGMKEIDGEAFFVGFPSYWNIIVLYLYWLQATETIVIVVIAVFSVLSFVSTRYIYPSRNPKYPVFTLGLGGVWVVLVAFMLVQGAPDRSLALISLIYPLYYLAASFQLEIAHCLSTTSRAGLRWEGFQRSE